MCKLYQYVIAAMTALLLAATPTVAFAADTQDAAMASSDSSVHQLFQLVNEERIRAGQLPLTLRNDVCEAAQIRANELELDFSHARPGGESFSTALIHTGISFTGAGENIAYGYQASEQVLQSWMSSSPHRASILNSSYTAIGIGHYVNDAGVDYWTQIFIR